MTDSTPQSHTVERVIETALESLRFFWLPRSYIHRHQCTGRGTGTDSPFESNWMRLKEKVFGTTMRCWSCSAETQTRNEGPACLLYALILCHESITARKKGSSSGAAYPHLLMILRAL